MPVVFLLLHTLRLVVLVVACSVVVTVVPTVIIVRTLRSLLERTGSLQTLSLENLIDSLVETLLESLVSRESLLESL